MTARSTLLQLLNTIIAAGFFENNGLRDSRAKFKGIRLIPGSALADPLNCLF
jgi:hypothetical protein